MTKKDGGKDGLRRELSKVEYLDIKKGNNKQAK
jgi:hypothetical protein